MPPLWGCGGSSCDAIQSPDFYLFERKGAEAQGRKGIATEKAQQGVRRDAELDPRDAGATPEARGSRQAGVSVRGEDFAVEVGAEPGDVQFGIAGGVNVFDFHGDQLAGGKGSPGGNFIAARRGQFQQ